MKHILKAVFVFCVVVSAGVNVFAKTVVVYHTSDVHGHYAGVNGKGGFPALAAQAKKEKAPVILLDSGDWFIGSREGAWTKGAASVLMMNKLGYSAVTLGNHDFDYGQDNLRAILSSAAFQVLGANIKKDGALVSYVKPYTVVTVNGLRLGIIGIANSNTAKLTLPGYVADIRFEDEAARLNAVLPLVEKERVNAVILLVHDGISTGAVLDGASWKPEPKDYADGTLMLARAAAGKVQVILGGHRHTLLLNGYRDKETGTLIGESGYGLASATRLELSFDDATGKFKGVTARVVDLNTDETGEDAAVSAAYKSVADEVSVAMSQSLGRVQAVLAHKPVKPNEADSPLGNLFCDMIRSYAKTQLAVQNSNGMLADIVAGPVTVGMVYDVVPYENSLVIEELSGAQLEAMMRESLAGKATPLEVSGMAVTRKPGRSGKPDTLIVTVDGKPVRADQYYTVATNNYLANGTAYADSLAAGRKPHDTLVSIRGILMDVIRASSGPLKVPATGRISK